MPSNGCSPTVITYNTLIDGLCKAEKYQEALSITREMVGKGFTPDIRTYGSLIRGLCQDKMINAALAIWNQISNKGLQADVMMYKYNILIHGLCSAGRAHEALRIYLEMKGRKNCSPNLVTYNTLMGGFYELGSIDKAASHLTAILDDGLKLDIITYNIRIKGLCSCNRIPEGFFLLDEVLASGIIPTDITWNILVRAVVAYGPIQICHLGITHGIELYSFLLDSTVPICSFA
jgi:pentatricopeptide repeat protein